MWAHAVCPSNCTLMGLFVGLSVDILSSLFVSLQNDSCLSSAAHTRDRRGTCFTDEAHNVSPTAETVNKTNDCIKCKCQTPVLTTPAGPTRMTKEMLTGDDLINSICRLLALR